MRKMVVVIGLAALVGFAAASQRIVLGEFFTNYG
jgi:hypothetical protein